VSIAGIAFPYRLKSTWESAGGRRLFGIPTVTLAGIGGVIVLGAFVYEFLFNPTINATFAVTRQLSLIFMISVPIIGAIWYAVAYYLNKQRGVDLALAYRELPPE
jgi:RsiW-degrading membrane proteinase PrsW (M82 family)